KCPGRDDERPQRGHAETIGRAAHRHRQAPGLTCKSGIKKRRTAFLRSASFFSTFRHHPTHTTFMTPEVKA
ncbi:Helix-turn-helix domain-containing protein, partial [Dysosmobacter welbionis]